MIDLRSDTVTKPSKPMLAAMNHAKLGDDVYGEDPCVNSLEKLSADMLGKDAAIFAPSGTQSNLIALMCHCQRGDEFIVGQQAHTYRYEAGGAAVLGSIQPQPIDNLANGTLDLADVENNIKSDDIHFAQTRLLCLENTHAGMALPLRYLAKSSELCKRRQLAHHLDGARIFNAAVKLEIDVRQISGHFDSISVCLSKGLGAPVGSVLCGSDALIDYARRIRKMLGGGMRQAGMLAAAGIYALENNIERLAHDHEKAQRLAEGLSSIDELKVRYTDNQTNMVFVEINSKAHHELAERIKRDGILISGRKHIRLVTHLDLSSQDIEYTVKKFKDYFRK